MALLNNKNFEFTGSVGNFSVYNMHGVEKPVVRTKGGADKKKIKNAPEFELTRQNYTEFGACGKTGGAIRRSMLALTPVADFNFTPKLNALAKTIQHLDKEGLRGQRSVYLSRHKNFINGFSLNKKTAFESIVKHPISFSLERNLGKAVVIIPSLTHGVNLMFPGQYPMFRFIVTLGAVADRVFTEGKYQTATNDESQYIMSDWFHAGEQLIGLDLAVTLKRLNEITENTTLILGLGIQMGIPLTPAVVEPVKWAGAAKVIGVG